MKEILIALLLCSAGLVTTRCRVGRVTAVVPGRPTAVQLEDGTYIHIQGLEDGRRVVLIDY